MCSLEPRIPVAISSAAGGCDPWLANGASGSSPSSSTNNESETAMSGKTDDMKGKAKEAVGDLTGDKDLQREGKADQTAGAVKDKIGAAKDWVEDKVDDVKDKVTDR